MQGHESLNMRTLALLHDDVDVVRVLDDLVEGDNIRMVRALCQHLRLVLPARTGAGTDPDAGACIASAACLQASSEECA